MDKDWRLVNQLSYLQGKDLVFSSFLPSKECDHRHCSFCWDKFGIETEMLHSGYHTTDNKWWICEQCFQDFSYEFQWRVLLEKTVDGSLS